MTAINDHRDLYFMVFLSFILVFIYVFQAFGALNGLDEYVYIHISIYNDFWIRLISFTAGSLFIIYIFIPVLLDLYREKRVCSKTVRFIFSLLVAMIVVWVTKSMYREPRPLGASGGNASFLKAFENPDAYAFPSGHAARASVLAYYYGRRGLYVLYWLWVFSVMASRVLLGAHWIGDVLASFFLGIFVSFIIDYTMPWWLWLYNKLFHRFSWLRINESC